GALADESRRPAVRIRARADAVVAARARAEVDQQHALAVDQPRVRGHLQVLRHHRIARGVTALLQTGDDGLPELTLDRRVLANGGLELVARNLDELDVLERLHRKRPRLVHQQRRFTGVLALAQIRDGELAAPGVDAH